MKNLVLASLLTSGMVLANDDSTKGVVDVIFDKGHFEESVKLAFSSFEEPTGFISGKYTSAGDPCAPHDLVNNTNQSPVDTLPFVVNEIGFDASYVPPSGCDPSSNDDGLSNDWVGVTSFDRNLTDVNNNPINTGNPDSRYTDGKQGYQIADPDGTMVLESAEIDLTGRTNVTISVDYFLDDRNHFTDPPSAGGWEIDDSLKIYAKDMATNTEYELVNIKGGINGIDFQNPSIEYVWNTATLAIPDNLRVKLFIEFTADSSREVLYLDNIVIRGL